MRQYSQGWWQWEIAPPVGDAVVYCKGRGLKKDIMPRIRETLRRLNG